LTLINPFLLIAGKVGSSAALLETRENVPAAAILEPSHQEDIATQVYVSQSVHRYRITIKTILLTLKQRKTP
jgi:hypothetical protein